MPVLPVLDPWASDSISLRRSSWRSVFVLPAFPGANERIPADAYYDRVEFLYRLLKAVT